jgi:hypothetical protein
MDNQQATAEVDMGWLVGFLEGEGSFSLQKQIYKKQKATLRPRISVTSTDFELTDRAGSIFQSLGIGNYIARKRCVSKDGRNYKDQKELVVSGIKRCKKLLDQIIPYMTESRKKRTAETLLEFCNYRLSLPRKNPYTQVDFSLGQRMRDLNGYQLRQSFRDSTRDVFDIDTKVESATA